MPMIVIATCDPSVLKRLSILLHWRTSHHLLWLSDGKKRTSQRRQHLLESKGDTKKQRGSRMKKVRKEKFVVKVSAAYRRLAIVTN